MRVGGLVAAFACLRAISATSCAALASALVGACLEQTLAADTCLIADHRGDLTSTTCSSTDAHE
jgi:hypothetical protein